MKLGMGDKIWITKADDRCEPGNLGYNVRKALRVEWDGKRFLGCQSLLVPGKRISWTVGTMRHYQGLIQDDSASRTNIDCMFEQLDAEGAFA